MHMRKDLSQLIRIHLMPLLLFHAFLPVVLLRRMTAFPPFLRKCSDRS